MPYTRADMLEFFRSGGAARRDNLPFEDDPFHGTEPAGVGIDEWCFACMNWQAGWVHEDRGRDQSVLRMLRAAERDALSRHLSGPAPIDGLKDKELDDAAKRWADDWLEANAG